MRSKTLRQPGYLSCAIILGALLAPAPVAAASRFVPLEAAPKVTISTFNDLPGSPGGHAVCVTSGPDRALWVTYSVDQEIGPSYIVKIGVRGRELAAYPSLQNGDIVAGPDNAVWALGYPVSGPPAVERVSPGGSIKDFTPDGTPISLALGPDRAFWYPEFDSTGHYAIGRMTTSGQTSSYSSGLSSGATLNDITAGPDGAMWFTETNGAIGRIATDTHTIAEYSMGITPASGPYSIALGPDGALWFTESSGHRIGRITTQGVVTESKPVASGGTPNDIVAGPDGAMWFTEDNPERIGRISKTGQITEYFGMSVLSFPTCIVTGPDGNLWFTDAFGNRMGRVNLH